MPDSALSIEELDEILSQYGESVALVGDGYNITADGFTKTSLVNIPESYRLQSALSVAKVAFEGYNNGKTVSDSALSVNYLRPSQAERERAERENQANKA